MMNLLIILLFVFLISFIYILQKSLDMRTLHAEKMNKLRAIIASLHQQQEALNSKLRISNQYDLHYKNEVKALGEEINALQKVFLEIITNQKK